MGQQRLGLRGRRLALAQHQGQGTGGLAQRTADTQQVTRPCTAAAQGLASRHAAEHGDSDTQGAARRVTTDQAHAATVGHATKAVGIGRQPVRANVREGQCEGKADCSRAHGCQVTGRHSQRSLAKQQRIANSRKVHPGDQGVGRHRQLLTGGKVQQGTVVADTQRHALATLRTGRSGEVMVDQLELTHDQAAPGSALVRLDFCFTQRRG
ncbi:hypothetical protein D9M71_483330 [compost metagenome]